MEQDLFSDIPKLRLSKSKVKTGKVCNKCGKYKSLRFFSRGANQRDGYRTTCKMCDKESQRMSRINISYIEVDYKQCSDCGKIKPIKEFGLDKTKKDHHRSYCLECLRERDKRIKNPNSRARKNNL